MADPVTLTIAAGVADAAGSVIEGIGAQRSANYNARLADQNAGIATMQAASEEARSRNDAARLAGEQVASYGASGVTLEGSPMTVMRESAVNAEMDALSIRYQGALKSRAYRAEADQQRFAGKQARVAGFIGGATKLLSGGAQVAQLARK